MAKDFNISKICLILNWFVYDPSWMMHLSEFVRTLRSSASVVLNNFLLIDATARSKISSDQKRFFIALSLYPLSFFANTPFKDQCLMSSYYYSKDNFRMIKIQPFSWCMQNSERQIRSRENWNFTRHLTTEPPWVEIL